MHGLDFITQDLRAADGACASLSAYGAHICSWRPAISDERLYLSARTQAGSGAAIRGGVPLIFPQFSAEGPLPRHGFARTQSWTLVGSGDAEAQAWARYALQDNAATRAIWPQAFAAELMLRVGGTTLDVELAIRNRGVQPFTFTAALHTYLRVHDLDAVRLQGLQGLRYRDTANGGRNGIDHDAALTIRGELDRIYFDAPDSLLLSEPGRQLRIASRGFADVVVWNPGAAKAAQLSDLDVDGWRQLLCVEAAAIGRPISLAPQQVWRGAQRLTAEQ